MSVDKNSAVIAYLSGCPAIAQNPIFFNFINAKDKSTQFVTVSTDKNVNKPYIDGSVLKRYTFTIIDYRSINYLPVVQQEGYSNENIDDFLDIQGIIDWITEQNDARNFPDFGQECVVDSISTTSETPNLNGVNTQVTPALAVYSISINIEYIDNSKKIWR